MVHTLIIWAQMLIITIIAMFACPIALLYTILSPTRLGDHSKRRRVSVAILWVLGIDAFLALVLGDFGRRGEVGFFFGIIENQLFVMVYGLLLWGAWRGGVRLWRRWSPADPAEQQSGVPS